MLILILILLSEMFFMLKSLLKTGFKQLLVQIAL